MGVRAAYQVGRGQPTDIEPDMTAQLRRAIETVPLERLRDTVLRLLDDEDKGAVRVALADAMLSEDHETGMPVPNSAVCKNCGDEYDPSEEREEGECVYHSGVMEVDYDADTWADHDENCHGPLDTKSNRRDYPEGFEWSCCDNSGDAPGCEETTHEPTPVSHKRRRT